MARVKSHTIIDDPALDPYFITRDEYNYIVNEKITTNANHFRSKGGSKEYDKAIKFFPNLKGALKFIAEEKLHTKKHYNSVMDFIDEYSKIESNLINLFNNG